MTERLKANWFWPVALSSGVIVWLLTNALLPQDLGYWEFAVLFDVLITLPLFFAICYRRTLTRKNLVIRIIALQCLGIWLAIKLVPVESQIVLPQLAWVRYAGLTVLIMIEVRIIFTLFKILFKPGTGSKQLEDVGMPPFLAKLALLEVRFWRWVFSVFKR